MVSTILANFGRRQERVLGGRLRYYESKLVTFPSPVTNDRTVKQYEVPGVYSKGRRPPITHCVAWLASPCMAAAPDFKRSPA